MANKIGRNDPCPCGSGLKYKKCCMGANNQANSVHKLTNNAETYCGANNWDSVYDYFKTHSSADIFNFIIGLQLSPMNHGKNVRIEDLARIAVCTAHSGGVPVNPHELQNILDKDFSENPMEDLPCNMFSEYVAFYGGGHTVFPGIACQSIEILNDLLFSVFKSKHYLPNNTETEICIGVQSLLSFGDYLAKVGGVEGNIKGGECETSKFDYSRCGKDYSIPITEVKAIQSEGTTLSDILDNFVLNLHDPSITSADPDHSPLLNRPIVEFEGNYYFLLISNQANAINTFVMNQIIACRCEDKIANTMHRHIWDRIRYGCTLMEWPLTNYGLPENNESNIDEVVAQMDVNWIVYLCYVHDMGENLKDAVNVGQFFYQIDDHISNAVGFLRKNTDTKNYNILTLLLYSSVGEMFMLPHNGGDLENYRVTFSAYDFIQLSQSEHWTRFSLLRFAQMVKRHESCFGIMSNSLDVYSLYKSKKESFYLSDDTKYSNIIIPPDDGMHIIFEAKCKRDFRTIELVKGESIVEMSVISALEDMPIFKPSTDFGEYYVTTSAYSIPIWVHCNQVNGKYCHEYEVADLYGMAIAFWLTKLSPALYHTVSSTFTHPITIELVFDSDVFDEYRRNEDFSEVSSEPYRFISSGPSYVLTIHRKAMSIMACGTNAG